MYRHEYFTGAINRHYFQNSNIKILSDILNLKLTLKLERCTIRQFAHVSTKYEHTSFTGNLKRLQHLISISTKHMG